MGAGTGEVVGKVMVMGALSNCVDVVDGWNVMVMGELSKVQSKGIVDDPVHKEHAIYSLFINK